VFAKNQAKGNELPKPNTIPDPVGTYLVTELKMEPDYVWRLMSVVRPWPDNKKTFHFRIYDEKVAAKKGAVIKNYLSLDDYQDLILFQGVCDSANYNVFMKDEYNTAKSGEIG